jgi:spermidine synthase
MKRWNLIDQDKTPDGKALTLHEHDGRYTIRVDGHDLMSTRQHHSEERIAELACAPLATRKKARVLIGGLGFGFTLRAVLRTVAADATVVVAELLPAVIRWNKDPALGLAAEPLADKRVDLVQSDVGRPIDRAAGGAISGFDAIILDVDNSPDALTADGNDKLYRLDGLTRALAALRPKGCAAYWSAVPDPDFAKLMSRAGFRVDVQKARAHPTSGPFHTLFLGYND